MFVMFWRTELMRKLLNYVPNMFLELLQKFGSNWNSNGFDTAKNKIKKIKKKEEEEEEENGI